MKRILFIAAALVVLVQACNGNSGKSPIETGKSNLDELDSGIVQCPYGHADSIIPIVYGYPTQEDFEKSDSGLIALGGCTLPDTPLSWFCKIHQLSF